MKRYEQVEREVVSNMRALTDDEIENGVDQQWDDVQGSEPVELGFYQPTGNRKLDAILANARPPIRYGGNASGVSQWMMDGENGVLPRGKSWIVQPSAEQFHSEQERRAILVHELVHWTKERGRAERPLVGTTRFQQELGIVPPGYAREELIAEMGTALVLDAIGEPVNPRDRARYLANWLSTVPRGQAADVMASAMADAERAADYLLQFCADVA